MAALRFWFSAPFRTRVTFDTPVLELCAKEARASFAGAAKAISSAMKVPYIPPADTPQLDSEHRYATLSEDADQQFVTPAMEISAPQALCTALGQAVRSADPVLARGNPRIDPGATRIVLFDNTVAILEWGVALDCEEGEEAAMLAAIDRGSFLASSAGVVWIQRELMPAVVHAIEDGLRRFDPLPGWPRFLPMPTSGLRQRRRLAHALRRPREATVFFDMPEASGGNGLMWVSRLLACPSPGPSAAARSWTGRTDAPRDTDDDDTRLIAGIGNSVLLEAVDGELGDAGSAYRKMQYFYALLDIHGRNITFLTARFLARRQSVLTDALARLERIQSHLSVVEARAIDTFAGLQGARARYCQALSKAWDLPGKQQGVHRKAAIARDMVERVARAQGMKYQKIVQFILAVVGVLALADVVINITAFSQSVGDDAAWGIVKAVRSVPPDTLLTGTGVVLAVAIVILGLLFRRG